MRILDELRYLRKLFVKNARRLLHLLTSSASKARADIAKLLQKYYTLVFTDVPARVHQTMVDFNQWLAAVLEDTRSEGIEWGPSYGENPWLALEEQPQDGPVAEAFTVDHASTIQLLRSACEYYMVRCESLQQSNVVLSTQLEELKNQLKEALVRAFDSQQTLEREREVSALQTRRFVLGVQIGDHLSQENCHGQTPTELHQQIADAFRMLDEVRAPHNDSETATVSEAASVADFGRDSSEMDVESGQGIASDVVETDTVPAEEHEAPLELKSVAEPISNGDECDYERLTTLLPSEETDCSWYQHALRSLKEKRQKRLKDKPKAESEASFEAISPSNSVCENSSFLDHDEFTKLAATRDAENEDSWYRRALQHLKNERQRRVSSHDRDSLSSTVSFVD